jgi:predicted RNA-binding protein associated with RNAse of E/G family
MIESGWLGDPVAQSDYRREQLGDTLVERVVWGDLPHPWRKADQVVADHGFVWFRFWLAGDDQVVERYYDNRGSLIGTQIDICTSLICDTDGCCAGDLILDIWISSDGQVTVHNEDAFELAVLKGDIEASQAARAEDQVRRLTAAIARGRFPPPLVRNWRIDPSRIAETTAADQPSSPIDGI